MDTKEGFMEEEREIIEEMLRRIIALVKGMGMDGEEWITLFLIGLSIVVLLLVVNAIRKLGVGCFITSLRREIWQRNKW